MKRQPGLPSLERVRQFANTLLSLLEPVENLQPRLIGQSMKEDSCFDSLLRGHRGHHTSIIID
ncbi:hypothetical protein NITLEN_20284 [Nitrospira lenta]|uniref:Uncharacterized protein n=1 Tax=Nitrospira lenta TaxID=1436998 RepID=A0A330L497_9BACT|nr:hypothetical protein NITLEN_20284 [Nitrospira lenta]